ncbi:MAG: ABC transporter permease [Kineosporiaceae bacterium]
MSAPAVDAPGEGPASAGPRGRRAAAIARDLLPVVGLVVLVVWFSVASPFFLDATNFRNLVTDSATLLLGAFGVTVVILVAEIDLSVGAVTSLLAVAMAQLLDSGTPWPLAAAAAVAAGIAVGLLNGAVTVFGDIPSFIVTLGTFSAATGLAFVLTGSIAVPITDEGFVTSLYFATILGLPVALYVVAAAFVAVWVLMRRTATGREMVAVGTNVRAARHSGVRVGTVRLTAFAVMGLMVGLGAVLAAARLGSGTPDAFPSLTLDVIAAAIIGGASLTGGRASLSRTLLGALLIAVLNNGLVLVGANTDIQFAIKGGIILVAVLLDRSSSTSAGGAT